MTAFFLIILGVPLLIAAGAFIFLKGITWKEFACIVGAQLVVAGSSAGIVSCANTHDTEVWNGVVTGKQQVSVPCSHSYQCNCHEECSGSGKNRSCSTHCDTCYEHFNDYDWDVYTSNKESITISRVDRQGVSAPPRWTATKMGEFTSVEHSYTNYIKASPGTLFRHQGLKEKYAGSLPSYPQNIYDYYRLNRVVTVGFSLPDERAWNYDLSKINSDLGWLKQVNIIVVLVKDKPDDWYYALEEEWVGGKKNDAILVVGVDGDLKPQWAQVMAWTTNEMFKVKLRDDVMAMPSLTHSALMTTISTDVNQTYVRKPMKDFEYLSSQITPSTTEWVITMIIGLLVAIGLVWFFETQDPFGDERWNNSYQRHRNVWHDISDLSPKRKPLHHHTKPWYRRMFDTRPWENV